MVMDGTECKREIHQLLILDRNMQTLRSKVPKADNFIRDFKILPLEIHLWEGISVFSKNLRAKIPNRRLSLRFSTLDGAQITRLRNKWKHLKKT